MNEDIYLDSYNQSYNLEEFKFSPVGLVPYTIYNSDFVNIPPIEIYSSKNIERRVLERVKESNITSDIVDLIERGLNNKKLIVGYTNPSKFKFVYQKIRQLAGLKRDWGLGFYDKLDDVTYIILDDNANLFGNVKFDLPLIIAHELCHMAAAQNSKTKIIESNMNNILLPFFANCLLYLTTNNGETYDSYEYSKEDYKKDINLKELKNTISKIFNFIEISNVSINQKTLYKVALDWDEYNNKVFKQNDELNNLDLSYTYMSLYLEKFLNIESNYDFNHLFNSIVYGYKKIGIDIKNQVLGQEFIYISEVLAISNENGFQSNVLKCIKKIDMGK